VNTKVLTLLMLSFISAAFAEDFKTTDGKEYKDATVSRIEPDGIVVKTKSGISKLYFTELPKEVQERFHYDAGKAAAYSNVQSAQTDQTNAVQAARTDYANAVQALQARYIQLQQEEDTLLLRIGEAKVGTYSGYPNPDRSQLPMLNNRLAEVRREKDEVRKQFEKAQR
jgi:hypothetical protein